MAERTWRDGKPYFCSRCKQHEPCGFPDCEMEGEAAALTRHKTYEATQRKSR